MVVGVLAGCGESTSSGAATGLPSSCQRFADLDPDAVVETDFEDRAATVDERDCALALLDENPSLTALLGAEPDVLEIRRYLAPFGVTVLLGLDQKLSGPVEVSMFSSRLQAELRDVDRVEVTMELNRGPGDIDVRFGTDGAAEVLDFRRTALPPSFPVLPDVCEEIDALRQDFLAQPPEIGQPRGTGFFAYGGSGRAALSAEQRACLVARLDAEPDLEDLLGSIGFTVGEATALSVSSTGDDALLSRVASEDVQAALELEAPLSGSFDFPSPDGVERQEVRDIRRLDLVVSLFEETFLLSVMPSAERGGEVLE